MTPRRLHLQVRGLVQGVCYRAHTQRQAQALGLTGWVRNREDGGVEVLAEGPEDALVRLVAACRRGPPAAVVDDVEVRWTAATGEFGGFTVRR